MEHTERMEEELNQQPKKKKGKKRWLLLLLLLLLLGAGGGAFYYWKQSQPLSKWQEDQNALEGFLPGKPGKRLKLNYPGSLMKIS